MHDAPGREPSWLIPHAVVQLAVLASSFTKAHDPDLGFHLATGRAVLALGHVPASNVLSFAEPQAQAVNQQWLPAVAFELSYRWLGIAGPTLIKMVLLALTFGLVVETARVLCATRVATTFASVLGVWAAAPRFVERPLLFSNLCIAIVALCIAHRYRARDEERKAPWTFVVASVATALAVQLHAGAVFAFGLLLMMAVVHLASAAPIARTLLPEPARAPLAEGLGWLASAIVAFACAALLLSLYHPHGLDVLTVPFTMATDPFLYTVLVEFRPPWAFPFASLSAYWALCALACVALGFALRIRSPVIAAVMAFGVALSLRHARFMDLASVLSVPGLSLLASDALTRVSNPVRFQRIVQALTYAMLTGVVALTLLGPGIGFGYDPTVWPIGLLRDARRLSLHGHSFVQDGWAGPFLAFRYPEERVFFHPAFDAYSQAFFRDVYMRTRDGEPGWDATLDRHRVQLVLMKYTSPFEKQRQEGKPNLRQRLLHDARWALVSFDAYGLLFARRTALRTDVARAAVIEGFDPDRLSFFGPPRVARPGLEQLARRLPSPLQALALREAAQ